MKQKVLEFCREINPDIPDDGSVNLLDEGYLDSFGAYMVLAQMELEYNISISDNEMNYHNFQNLNSMVDLIARKLESKNG